MKKIVLSLMTLLLSLTLISCNKETDKVNISFMIEGQLYKSVEVEKGNNIKRPDNPEKPSEDSEFDGWYKSENYQDANRWIFSDEVAEEDMSLYARWIDSETEVQYYTTKIDLPSLSKLDDAEEIEVVADAPDLMIIGLVLDTFHYYHSDSMSGYEYIKVFNNTNKPYNMKNHRIVLADPLQGQNGETEEAKKGIKSLVTGHLFNSFIDDDFIIDPLGIALIWLKPYYWQIGSGTGAYNKPFTADLIHTTTGGKKGAFEQKISDFREFWEISEDVQVHAATNQPIVAKRMESGTEDFFPMISPGAGTPYTHLNSSLLRSIDIMKLNDKGGSAKVEVLNKYDELSPIKQLNPDLVFGKQAFNVMHLTDNNETINTYGGVNNPNYDKNDPNSEEFIEKGWENAWEYFDNVVRVNFHGLVDETKLNKDSIVNFRSVYNEDSNPGNMGWANTVELQFRPPKIGEKIMQLQIPLRELRKINAYVASDQLEVIRVVEGVNEYRWEKIEVYLLEDPSVTEINWRKDEIKSPGRMNAANPTGIKAINLTRP